MSRLIARLASLRLTLLLMVALAFTALGAYKNPALAITWVTIPMAALATNLLAAIIHFPRFRQQAGLLIFHIGLLLIIILSGVGILTNMEGHIEIAEGQAFEPEQVVIDKLGPWHRLRLDELRFVQGAIKIDFYPMLRQARTESQVWVPDASGKLKMVTIGDNESLESSAYRLLTTFNKGYALLLSWIEPDGSMTTGTVHLPSYPMNEWRQKTDWVTPAGEKLSLALSGPLQAQEDDNWIMSSSELDEVKLQISTAESVSLISTGTMLERSHGTLKFEGVRLWMGYQIDYNPMLIWQLFASILTVIGLVYHFWHKFSFQITTGKTQKFDVKNRIKY